MEVQLDAVCIYNCTNMLAYIVVQIYLAKYWTGLQTCILYACSGGFGGNMERAETVPH